MSKSKKWTPGPWYYAKDIDADCLAVYAKKQSAKGFPAEISWNVAYVTNATPTSTKEEIEANAALIASAPQLAEEVERLRQLLREIHTFQDHSKNSNYVECGLYNRVFEALKESE